MIEKEEIEAIKRDVDLIALIESKGIPLKKNGKGYKGLCPFHEDTNPSLSVNPSTNLWNCFGCDSGGDVIRFVEHFDKVDFKEAVQQLSVFSKQLSVKKKDLEPPTVNRKSMTVKERKLLNRVIEFYHTAFCEDSRAKEYLVSRGITDNEIFSSFKIGFSNGTLINVLPVADPAISGNKEDDIIQTLKAIGVLNNRGKELFYGCVTVPLYDLSGNPCGLYGRRIDGMIQKDAPNHLYLPGPRHGLFNRQTAKSHKEIILTESIIDALTLINAGIKNAIPCYGVHGMVPAHVKLFKQNVVDMVHICFDADDMGRKAAEKVGAKLESEGIRTHAVNLTEGYDINSFFSLNPLSAGQAGNAKDRFMELLHETDPEAVQTVKPTKEPVKFIPTEYGFSMTIKERTYEVKGIYKNLNKLKATVKGIKQDEEKSRFHVDTIDFYSARSRAFLIKGLCDLFGENESIITEDVEKLTEFAEKYRQPKEKDKDEGPATMTHQEKQRAFALLKNPIMFDEILMDFETLGYTGEEMNKLLCYIAAISRKMEEPLSVMIQSRSAAGKSFLQDTALSMVPEEDYIKYTRLTDQALFYKESDSLAHKILAIEELDGMNGAIYSIRSIQSSKKITIAYTGKDPDTGKLKTEENTVEGPLMVFITTTAVDIDGETASRFVFISIDESEEMTKKILKKQRQSHTMEGMINKLKSAEIIAKHKNANKLLRPLFVFNPYADLLTFTSKSLRARRDHTKYLNLILAITYLFQYQRKIKELDFDGKNIKYINVTLTDIEKANEIANVVLGRSLDELTPPSRNLLKLIREMVMSWCKEKDCGPEHCPFTRRDIREYSGWSDFQVKTHIRQLEELEYVYAVIGKKGKEYVYELLVTEEMREDWPFLVGLTDIQQLKKKAKQAGIKDDLENL